MKTCWSKFCRRVTGCVNWVTILIVILVFGCVIISAFALDISISSRNSLERLETQTAEGATGITETELQFYRELNDKTDDAINRMITFVGIFVGVVALFGFLLAFKAPRDIDRRMDELNDKQEAAEKALEEAKKAAEDGRYQAEIAQGMIEKTLSDRIYAISKILKKYPDKPDAYNLRGNLWTQKTGSPKVREVALGKAVVDYNTALDYGYEKDTCYNNLGSVYFSLSEVFKKDAINKKAYLERALNNYKKAIKECGSDAILHYNIGTVYSSLEDFDSALTATKKAISIYPEFARAYGELSNIYNKMAARENSDQKIRDEYLEMAGKNLRKAKELDPERYK